MRQRKTERKKKRKFFFKARYPMSSYKHFLFKLMQWEFSYPVLYYFCTVLLPQWEFWFSRHRWYRIRMPHNSSMLCPTLYKQFQKDDSNVVNSDYWNQLKMFTYAFPNLPSFLTCILSTLSEHVVIADYTLSFNPHLSLLLKVTPVYSAF